jgi:hypothetical protein
MKMDDKEETMLIGKKCTRDEIMDTNEEKPTTL